VENLDFTGMQDVTDYAPMRIVVLGALKAIYGLFVGFLGELTLWAAASGEFQPTKSGDMPHWWFYILGALLTFGGIALLTGGVGRIVSGFARNCYFRAGPEGLAVRLPKYFWFGRYQIIEYRFAWSQIKGLVHFTRRLNFIPFGWELHIEPQSGKMVSIERHFFTDSIKTVQKRLLSIETMVGK
jgi:hypothetical protein